jgi:hypothetical protein
MALVPSDGVALDASCDFCRGTRYLEVEGADKVPCPYCKGQGTNDWRAGAARQYVHRQATTTKLLLFFCPVLIVTWFVLMDVAPYNVGIDMLFFPVLLAVVWLFRHWQHRQRTMTLEQRGVNSPVAPMVWGGLGIWAAHRYIKRQRGR